MKFKHLVTSGCSFAARAENSWPIWLSDSMNTQLHSYGVPSAGNAWVSKSLIHGVQKLLDSGVTPDEILAVVMWTGIDRKDLFITSRETPDYFRLRSNISANPVNFIDETIHWVSSDTDGYLLGTMACNFKNSNINALKHRLVSDFYTEESLAIESYENFLRVQWYCKANGVKLFNHTYMDIMHYPTYSFSEPSVTPMILTKDTYSRNIGPLYSMINFDDWIFWGKTGGMYEYTRDNNLPFNSDGVHPTIKAYSHYVENFLSGEIAKKL